MVLLGFCLWALTKLAACELLFLFRLYGYITAHCVYLRSLQGIATGSDCSVSFF